MSLPLAIAGPSSSKLKSCDSCRLRRIKCVREPAGNETCQKCAEKSIRCTVLRQMNPRRKMNRDGSVIARARETFGSAGALTKHQYTNEIFEEGIRSFNALPSSTNSKLGDAEIEGTLTLHLMEEFFSNHYGQMQPLNWMSFRSRFDAAGKRPENMLPQEEVLCAFLIMMGARLSDHPLLLRGTTGLLASPDSGQSSGRSGSQSPDSADASDGTVSTQTDIGKLREHVNRKLFERAISLADAKGTIRNPTEESVASLLFMHQGLTRDERMVQGRIYCKATLEHIRILAEQNDALPLTVQPKNRTIGDRAWNLWLMDAMIVARSGIKPTFDEEDFIRYCPTSDMSLTDILPLFKTSPWKGFPSLKGHEEGYFWTCVTPFLREIGNTGLKIGKFTSPRALKLPFQEKQFLEVISALYFLQLSMPHLEPALLKLRPEFIEVWPCNALYYLSLNTITWAHLVMAAKTLVVQRQTDSVPDPEKGGKMARVAPVVNQLAFDSSRQVAYVFHRLRTLGKKLASFMALGFIMTQIPIIAHELVQGEIERIPKKAYEPLPSLPGVTDHPPPEACQFTAERKLMELEWMLEGVRNCTYAHGDDALRETVAYLTFELEKLKKEQDTFLATSFLIGSQQSSPEDEYSPPMCGDENLKLCRGDSGDFNNTSVKEMVPADFSAAEELHRLQQTLLALQQSGQLDADLLRNANLSSQFLNLPPPRHDGAIG